MDAREKVPDERDDQDLSTADLASSSRSSSTATEDAGDVRTTSEEGQGAAPLLGSEESAGFSRRWEEIQARFVDEPRGSVESADQLVAELMKRLAESFAEERANLERQWDRGEDISTEDLRVALQRYRSFFERLLAA
jgi:hypothetical protein